VQSSQLVGPQLTQEILIICSGIVFGGKRMTNLVRGRSSVAPPVALAGRMNHGLRCANLLLKISLSKNAPEERHDRGKAISIERLVCRCLEL
jgi:hypothetical protein